MKDARDNVATLAPGVLRRLAGVTPVRVGRELGVQLRRAVKWWSIRRSRPASSSRNPVFVVGCHRSGTNMLMWTLEKSPGVWVYHEHRWNRAFRDYRLRPTPTIERLIRRSPAPTIAFKPVCEAHLTDRFLERHAGARAVWIYRHYPDVVNSAVRNWGGHHKDIMRWITRGDTDWLGWRGERLASEVEETVRALFREDMSHEEASALMWWIRNRFYFDLGLDQDARVLLVKYEDLVTGDEQNFRRVFDFVRCPYDPAYHADVFPTSIGRRPAPRLQPQIDRLCADLEARLDASYFRSRDFPTGGSQ